MKEVILVGNSLSCMKKRKRIVKHLESVHGFRVVALLDCDRELHNRYGGVMLIKKLLTKFLFPGIKVYKGCDITRDGTHADDIFIIPDCEMYESLENIILEKQLGSNSHIYIYDCNSGKMAERQYTGPVLMRIGYHVSWRCNLRCKGCFHWSNLYKGNKQGDLVQFKKDLIRLNELFGKIKIIDLVGGEPLLNPHISDFIIVARSIFPETVINVVSNGLLIPKVSKDIFEVMRTNQASFQITNYPPTGRIKDEIIEILNKYDVKYTFSAPVKEFYSYYTEKIQNPEKSFKKCYFWECHALWNGKLSVCGMPIYYAESKEYIPFKRKIQKGDFIDIYNAKSGEEILEKLRQPTPFCRYCDTHKRIHIPWEGNYTSAFPKCKKVESM